MSEELVVKKRQKIVIVRGNIYRRSEKQIDNGDFRNNRQKGLLEMIIARNLGDFTVKGLITLRSQEDWIKYFDGNDRQSLQNLISIACASLVKKGYLILVNDHFTKKVDVL